MAKFHCNVALILHLSLPAGAKRTWRSSSMWNSSERTQSTCVNAGPAGKAPPLPSPVAYEPGCFRLQGEAMMVMLQRATPPGWSCMVAAVTPPTCHRRGGCSRAPGGAAAEVPQSPNLPTPSASISDFNATHVMLYA